MPETPPEPRLSATILLIRDADPTLEVFMVERHHQIDFAEGALVFPGGKLEACDGAPELAAHARDSHLHSEAERALRVAAIRETFEECGVLLARQRSDGRLVDATRLASIEKRYRSRLVQDASTLLELVESEDLELAFDLLVPFAHWITPTFMPKRFDTRFFLVAAPPDQLAAHDGDESVDSIWTSVPDALELERTGRRTIIFPTLENLKKLGRSDLVEEAMERARRETIVPVLPALVKDADGELWLEIPEAADYDTVRAPMSALMDGQPTGGGGGAPPSSS